MSLKPLAILGSPVEVSDNELQIVSPSAFRLPDGWLIEERPRSSNPSHVDRYYYEPGTRRKFRSLLAVRRHLAGETTDYLIRKRKISKNEYPNFIESGAGQQCNSSRAIENFLSGENAGTTTPKTEVKSVVGENKRASGGRSVRKPVHKYSSIAEDEKMTAKSLKHTIQSALFEKPNSQKKTKSEKDDRASMHNLTEPPPERVSWVLSGPAGFWSPFLDDSIVPESEKLKWSEAFVLSIHDDGFTDGL